MGVARRFFLHWQNWLGLFIVLVFVLTALFAPLLSPKNLETKDVVQSYLRVPQPPSPEAPLGTLPDKSSVYDALVWGTRDALKFGVGVTAFVFVFGTLIGTIAAFFGGRVNKLLMWTTDSFLAFPIIAAVVFFQQINNNLLVDLLAQTEYAGFYTYVVNTPAILESFMPLYSTFMKLNPTALAFALFMWMPYARVMNASVMRMKQMEFVLAAKVSGAKKFRVIFRHLIPNAIAPVFGFGCQGCRGFGCFADNIFLHRLGAFHAMGFSPALRERLDFFTQGHRDLLVGFPADNACLNIVWRRMESAWRWAD